MATTIAPFNWPIPVDQTDATSLQTPMTQLAQAIATTIKVPAGTGSTIANITFPGPSTVIGVTVTGNMAVYNGVINSSYGYTVARAGLYVLAWNLVYAGTTSTDETPEIQFRVNPSPSGSQTTGTLVAYQRQPYSTQDCSMGGSRIVALNAGDAVALTARGSTNQSIRAGASFDIVGLIT